MQRSGIRSYPLQSHAKVSIIKTLNLQVSLSASAALGGVFVALLVVCLQQGHVPGEMLKNKHSGVSPAVRARVCVCRQLCFCATATLCVVKGTVSQVAVGDPCFPQTSVVKHTSRKTVTSAPLYQHLLAVPSSDSVVVGDTRGSRNTKLILFLLERRTR